MRTKHPNYLYHVTPWRNIEGILSQGLIPQVPDEWRGLIPPRHRNKPIIWLLGNQTLKANIGIDVAMLDPTKLHKLYLRDKKVDWWYYNGVIPPSAIFTLKGRTK